MGEIEVKPEKYILERCIEIDGAQGLPFKQTLLKKESEIEKSRVRGIGIQASLSPWHSLREEDYDGAKGG